MRQLSTLALADVPTIGVRLLTLQSTMGSGKASMVSSLVASCLDDAEMFKWLWEKDAAFTRLLTMRK